MILFIHATGYPRNTENINSNIKSSGILETERIIDHTIVLEKLANDFCIQEGLDTYNYNFIIESMSVISPSY